MLHTEAQNEALAGAIRESARQAGWWIRVSTAESYARSAIRGRYALPGARPAFPMSFGMTDEQFTAVKMLIYGYS